MYKNVQIKPLTNQLKYFVDVINGKQLKKSKIKEGLDVVKILKLASDSLKNKNSFK